MKTFALISTLALTLSAQSFASDSQLNFEQANSLSSAKNLVQINPENVAKPVSKDLLKQVTSLARQSGVYSLNNTPAITVNKVTNNLYELNENGNN